MGSKVLPNQLMGLFLSILKILRNDPWKIDSSFLQKKSQHEIWPFWTASTLNEQRMHFQEVNQTFN